MEELVELSKKLDKHETRSQERYTALMDKLDGVTDDVTGGDAMTGISDKIDLHVGGGGMDNTAAILAATMGNRNNDGFGNGGGLGLIALLALLGGRGRGGLFGGDGDGGAAAVGLQSSIDTNTILQSLGDIKAAVPLAEAQVQLALAGAQADITSQSLQQTIALQNQGFNSQLANLQGFNSVGDKVDALAAANALAIATNQFNCVQATMADGEKTRALISSIDKQNDNRLITAQANEIIELRSERNRDADRHGIEINMINNQNQVQAQFQQQQQVLSQLANLIVVADQNIRATNQAINIGGTMTGTAQTNSSANTRVN